MLLETHQETIRLGGCVSGFGLIDLADGEGVALATVPELAVYQESAFF